MMRKFLFSILALLLLTGCAPRRTAAQFIGYTSPQTVNQQIFGGQAMPATNITSPVATTNCVPTNGSPCGIPNLGQSVHFVTVRTSAAGSVYKIILEAQNGDGNWFAIGDSISDSGSAAGVFTGFATTGSYAAYRLNFIGGTGGGVFNVWYSGTSVSASQGLNPSASDRRIIAVAPNPSGFGGTMLQPGTNVFVFPPYGSSAGTLYVQYRNNNCAGGTIAVQTGPDANHVATVATFSLANVLTLQSFNVPDVKGSVMNYQSTACGTEQFDVYHNFSRPGSSGGTGTGAQQVQTNGADPCASTAIAKLSAVVTAPAAATTQIIAGVAGQQIFVCAYHLGVVTAAAGTYQWTTGTGGTCAAATVTKTGAVPINTGSIPPFTYGYAGTLFTAAAGSGLCLTLTGAGDNAAGIVTYVQQ